MGRAAPPEGELQVDDGDAMLHAARRLLPAFTGHSP